MLGLGISLWDRLRASSGEGSSDTAKLFAAGELGAWFDPSDASTVFQDAAATIPALPGDAVGAILDKSGRGLHARQAVQARCPILRQQGTSTYLEFDGVDDVLTTTALDLSGLRQLALWAAVRIDRNTAVNRYLSFSDGTFLAPGGFALYSPSASGRDDILVGAAGSGGEGAGYRYQLGVASPFTGLQSARVDLAATSVGGQLSMRINRTPVPAGAGGVLSTGAFAAHALRLGAQSDATGFLAGRLYGVVVRAAATSDDQVAAVESELATRAGLVL